MTIEPEVEFDQKITDSKIYAELFDYEGAVKSLAHHKSTKRNLSAGEDKGAIVVGSLISQAKSSVQIYTSNFKSKIYNDKHDRVADALAAFLSNKGKITVIMTDYDYNENPFNNNVLALLSRYHTNKGNISLNIIERDNVIETKNINYIVGDNKMYRLEYNPELYHAEFCFNDHNKAEELNKRFQKSLLISKPLDMLF